MGHGLDAPVILVTLSELGQGLDEHTLKSELTELLQEINTEVPAFERISHVFVCDEWTIGNALLTPTMKLKRKQIEEHYRELALQHMDSGPVIFLNSNN